MTLLFSHFSPKKPKWGIFWPKFKHSCFSWNFANRPIWGCWFEIWQQFFRILAQKKQTKRFFVPNLGIFVLSWNFASTQNRGCWYHYMTISFSNSRQNIPKLGTFGHNFKNFYVFRNFANRRNWGCWFQIWQLFLKKKINARKYPNKAFLVQNNQIGLCGPNFRHICFFTKLWNYTSLKVVTGNITTVFQSYSLRIPK